MPHLEALSWHDQLCLDGAFFRIVTDLSIRHLRLEGVSIGGICRLGPPATPLVVPLESLFSGYGPAPTNGFAEANQPLMPMPG